MDVEVERSERSAGRRSHLVPLAFDHAHGAAVSGDAVGALPRPVIFDQAEADAHEAAVERAPGTEVSALEVAGADPGVDGLVCRRPQQRGVVTDDRWRAVTLDRAVEVGEPMRVTGLRGFEVRAVAGEQGAVAVTEEFQALHPVGGVPRACTDVADGREPGICSGALLEVGQPCSVRVALAVVEADQRLDVPGFTAAVGGVVTDEQTVVDGGVLAVEGNAVVRGGGIVGRERSVDPQTEALVLPHVRIDHGATLGVVAVVCLNADSRTRHALRREIGGVDGV